jgi:hypothetical protein
VGLLYALSNAENTGIITFCLHFALFGQGLPERFGVESGSECDDDPTPIHSHTHSRLNGNPPMQLGRGMHGHVYGHVHAQTHFVLHFMPDPSFLLPRPPSRPASDLCRLATLRCRFARQLLYLFRSLWCTSNPSNLLPYKSRNSWRWKLIRFLERGK